MLVAAGFKPLLVNFESMTAKTRVGGVANTASHGKLIRPCIILNIQIRSPWLRVNSQSADHSELSTKELWRAGACFRGAMSFTSSA